MQVDANELHSGLRMNHAGDWRAIESVNRESRRVRVRFVGGGEHLLPALAVVDVQDADARDGLVRLSEHTVTAECRRRGCRLPAEFDGLCEPCWETGRDEL